MINKIFEKYDALMNKETDQDCEARTGGYIWKHTASSLLKRALEEFAESIREKAI